MLSPYRVLDLTTQRGLLCGQILGDLGADVVHVEPPGGSPARRLGPFAGDVPHPDRSLFWWAQTRNQRSITLDLDAADGRAILRRLAASAHFVLESDEPGAMARRGFGPDALLAINPSLVHVSITPFGQDGPKARWAASDPGRPPAPPTLPPPAGVAPCRGRGGGGRDDRAPRAPALRPRTARGRLGAAGRGAGDAILHPVRGRPGAAGAPHGGRHQARQAERAVRLPGTGRLRRHHLSLRLRHRALRPPHHGIRPRRGLL